MKNVYRVTTRLGENSNWASYTVLAENGFEAAVWLNANVLNRTARGKLKKTRDELVDEISHITTLDY